MSHFSDYFSEVEELTTIEKPYGFITYKITGMACLICHFYIEPKERGKSKAFSLIKELEAAAKESSCNIMSCTVLVDNKNSSKRVALFIKYGFEIKACIGNNIVLAKTLE